MSRSFIILFLSSIFLFEVNGKERETVPYLEASFCKQLKEEVLNGKYRDFREISIKKKKLFLGERIDQYNPSDYTLWFSIFDIQADGTEDLIAIDFLQRSRNTFYAAYYVFPDYGKIASDKEEMKKFFIKTKVYPRHPGGVKPLFPEKFYIKLTDGSMVSESFVGYHLIEPLSFEGGNYIYAQRGKGHDRRGLLFNADNSSNLSIYCII